MNATLKNRIEELRMIQANEKANNFPNGDLWNECEDKIYFIHTYGQENAPVYFYDENGFCAGIELENGQKIHFEGMSVYNSAD